MIFSEESGILYGKGRGKSDVCGAYIFRQIEVC